MSRVPDRWNCTEVSEKIHKQNFFQTELASFKFRKPVHLAIVGDESLQRVLGWFSVIWWVKLYTEGCAQSLRRIRSNAVTLIGRTKCQFRALFQENQKPGFFLAERTRLYQTEHGSSAHKLKCHPLSLNLEGEDSGVVQTWHLFAHSSFF